MSITLDLPAKFASELAEVTQEEGLTSNEIVTKALSDYFFVRKFRRVREKMQDQTQRKYTDEEIFRIVS
jgi:hypothetical protein